VTLLGVVVDVDVVSHLLAMLLPLPPPLLLPHQLLPLPLLRDVVVVVELPLLELVPLPSPWSPLLVSSSSF